MLQVAIELSIGETRYRIIIILNGKALNYCAITVRIIKKKLVVICPKSELCLRIIVQHVRCDDGICHSSLHPDTSAYIVSSWAFLDFCTKLL